jgi:hypothetical protein
MRFLRAAANPLRVRFLRAAANPLRVCFLLAAGNPVSADNKRLKGEVARHKEQLEALRQKDPEFYA